MMTVAIRAEVIGARFQRLLIFIDQVRIGEYERAQAADIERKTEEVIAPEADLLSRFNKHGELVVLWNRKTRDKVVCRLDGVRVGSIPKHACRKPSWMAWPTKSVHAKPDVPANRYATAELIRHSDTEITDA